MVWPRKSVTGTTERIEGVHDVLAQEEDGALAAMQYDLRFRGEADGESTLRLPDSWGGQNELWKGIERLEAVSGATMRDVVEGIGRVTQIMAEISNATRTQTDDIEYVDAAIVELDDTTCQNAALVEQAASAAEALRTQAAELAGVVHTFQLEA